MLKHRYKITPLGTLLRTTEELLAVIHFYLILKRWYGLDINTSSQRTWLINTFRNERIINLDYIWWILMQELQLYASGKELHILLKSSNLVRYITGGLQKFWYRNTNWTKILFSLYVTTSIYMAFCPKASKITKWRMILGLVYGVIDARSCENLLQR